MIKILHLYYDLLNLYGEQGNILALKEAFKRQNIEVLVDYLSLNDDIVFDNYDIVYVGTGCDNNLYLALNDIKRFKKDIDKYINSNKVFIATGNSYLLFGKSINDIKALGIFDYYARDCDRLVGEVLAKYNDLDIIGFENRKYIVNNKSNHLFSIVNGYSDNFKSSYEGFHFNNFFGTQIIGPLLIRNPKFTNMIVKTILDNNNFVYHDDSIKILDDAHNEYIKNFYK